MDREVITTGADGATAASKPKSSADRSQSSKRKQTKKRQPRADVKPNVKPKKTALMKNLKSSLARSKNLPPSAYMRPVITSIGENGERDAVEWVNVGVEPTPAKIQTMAERVETRMLIIIAGGQSKGNSTELRAAYAAQLQQMRQRLGAGDDLLETLLIERIVLTWARLQYVEEQVSYTYMRDSNAATAEYWDKRLSDAHSRFLRSCLALERVRKLRRRPGMGASAAVALLNNLSTGDWSAADGLRMSRDKGAQ